jgi:hypothetical protein
VPLEPWFSRVKNDAGARREIVGRLFAEMRTMREGEKVQR